MHAPALRPDRLRHLERPFGWIPFRILSSGYLEQLGPEAKLLYFFLCLVADARGISFYGDRRLVQLLGVSGGELEQARRELCGMDLLAFDGRVYQLLSLPPPGSEAPAGGHPAPEPPSEAPVVQCSGGRTRMPERRSAEQTTSSLEPVREILRRLGCSAGRSDDGETGEGASARGAATRRSRRWW